MRNLVLYIALSLDGFIARKDGSVDWLFTDNNYGYNEFINTIDTVIMGYKTYKKVLTFGEYEYRDKISYIFTRKDIPPKENILFINKGITGFTRELKRKEGKDIWLVGGGEIFSLLAAENLIDEFLFFIHPVILGKGISLFKDIQKQIDLKYKHTARYPSGLIKLQYVKKPGN